VYRHGLAVVKVNVKVLRAAAATKVSGTAEAYVTDVAAVVV
jgi:hypothetical protein